MWPSTKIKRGEEEWGGKNRVIFLVYRWAKSSENLKCYLRERKKNEDFFSSFLRKNVKTMKNMSDVWLNYFAVFWACFIALNKRNSSKGICFAGGGGGGGCGSGWGKKKERERYGEKEFSLNANRVAFALELSFAFYWVSRQVYSTDSTCSSRRPSSLLQLVRRGREGERERAKNWEREIIFQRYFECGDENFLEFRVRFFLFKNRN